ncbi:hypothetical protein PtA15_13A278 [Puccinia triticina]|uniref:Transmembrane protein n=1 Tax=Puccinia triticina TaxID=208348 RepID=A0ABY7CZX8_9BASI|nr:uncharacterized protein PtA15_13A278 [Puccinia triticina]WAQ90878.1 hypothetical protein PtA15_13A278 [Puccinia triticina]
MAPFQTRQPKVPAHLPLAPLLTPIIHHHLIPPRSRKCNLLLLTLAPIAICLSSLTFIFNQTHPTSPSPARISIKLFDQHQRLKSQAKQLSSDLLSWLDSVPNPLRSSASPDSDPDNPLLNPPNDHSPHPILPLLLSARQAWQSTLQSQPLSLQQARIYYHQKFYPLQPPPGFGQWFQTTHAVVHWRSWAGVAGAVAPCVRHAGTCIKNQTGLRAWPARARKARAPRISSRLARRGWRSSEGHLAQTYMGEVHPHLRVTRPPQTWAPTNQIGMRTRQPAPPPTLLSPKPPPPLLLPLAFPPTLLPILLPPPLTRNIRPSPHPYSRVFP